eukprot:Opistho-2@2558
MPTYELSMLVRYAINQAQAAILVKQVAETVLAKGGIVRTISNLSTDTLPYRIRSPVTRQWHVSARHLTMTFDASPKWVKEVPATAGTSADIVRTFLVKVQTPELDARRPYRSCSNLSTGDSALDHPIHFESNVVVTPATRRV